MNSIYLNRINKFSAPCTYVFFIIMLFLSSTKAMGAKIESSCDKIMEEKCSKCHSEQRILFLKRTPQEWSVTLRRMKEKDPMWLSDEDIIACLNFLTFKFALTGKDLFEQLCVDCHMKVGKKYLLYQRKTIPAWARAIERMRRKYNFYIGVVYAQKIKEFLTDPNNNKNLKLNIEEADLIEGVFEDKCGRCHTYRFMYGQKKTRQDWLETLTRMQEKSPRWMSQLEFEQIKKYIFSNNKLLLDKN